MLSSLPGASGPGSKLEFRAAVLDPGPELLTVGLASLQSLSSGLFLVLILGQSTLVLRAEHSDVKIPLFGYYFYRKLGMACGLGGHALFRAILEACWPPMQLCGLLHRRYRVCIPRALTRALLPKSCVEASGALFLFLL